MKLRNKEVNIFSMSALDLFASALGAFMLLAIVALPFFPNTGDSPELVENMQAEMQAEIDELREQLESQNTELETASDILAQTQEELAQCQAEIPAGDILTSTRNELEACQAQLRQTFVLTTISWDTTDDVDLHIIDPAGNEYYYAERSFPGSDAAFAEDNQRGPGNEIWLSPSAMQGDYEVYINMFTKRDAAAAVVSGSVLFQNGRIEMPDTTLNDTGQKPLVVTFNVDDQGNVVVL